MQLTCDRCGLLPGRPTIDPFAWEVYAERHETTLCDPCYAIRVEDI